ncbi:GTP cyclohydrolase I [Microbacterium sp. ASV49]|uniref:GTP cyclohydrolase 1 n=1 Tax=Microbacterium candidum TaxID=3041922 RepID=A0ABT7N346_9MICO|nr:GTP cyclohydrolase I [Microbacterium sp. ASV49]MDL9981101.1 GTP cyclohydrolase I [Microbacterium sp. ASV49]
MNASTALHALADDPVDRDRAEAAVAELLTALGHDLAREHLTETPRRVVDGLLELTTPEPFAMTTFANDTGYDDLVVVRGIRFTSLCAHHLLPFRGEAVVAYLPGERLVGLSKLARVVERRARGLQVQESLTAQIADDLDDALAPRGVGVVLRAEHLCMSIRGVRAPESLTETAAFRGVVAHDERLQGRILDGRSGS